MNLPEFNGPLAHMKKKFGPDIYKGMAEQLYPEGSTLKCPKCLASRHATMEEVAKYLKDGFPTCRKCGVKTDISNPWATKIEFDKT